MSGRAIICANDSHPLGMIRAQQPRGLVVRDTVAANREQAQRDQMAEQASQRPLVDAELGCDPGDGHRFLTDHDGHAKIRHDVDAP